MMIFGIKKCSAGEILKHFTLWCWACVCVTSWVIFSCTQTVSREKLCDTTIIYLAHGWKFFCSRVTLMCTSCTHIRVLLLPHCSLITSQIWLVLHLKVICDSNTMIWQFLSYQHEADKDSVLLFVFTSDELLNELPAIVKCRTHLPKLCQIAPRISKQARSCS